MAMFILVLFPVGALITTLRLERNARELSEEMTAAAFCEDIYNRCLREGNFTAVGWTNLKKDSSYDYWYAAVGASKTAAGKSADNKVYLPAVRLKDGTFYTPLMREGWTKKPQYRIELKGTHDVRVSLRWGLNGSSYNRYYHK